MKNRTASATIHCERLAEGARRELRENNGVSVSNALDLNNSKMMAFVTFDTEDGRQSLFDKGVIEEVDGA
jgi:hypothetical protein